MNTKQSALLAEFFAQIPPGDRPFFDAVTAHAAALGYMPRRNKTKTLSIDFVKSATSATQNTIMKIEPLELGRNSAGAPGIRLKYFAAPKYSAIFQDAVRHVIEEFGGRYTGCYGCGRCDGTRGYTFVYPDGRSVFRCGSELLSVRGYSEADIDEIKQLMNMQDAFWASCEK